MSIFVISIEFYDLSILFSLLGKYFLFNNGTCTYIHVVVCSFRFLSTLIHLVNFFLEFFSYPLYFMLYFFFHSLIQLIFLVRILTCPLRIFLFLNHCGWDSILMGLTKCCHYHCGYVCNTWVRTIRERRRM